MLSGSYNTAASSYMQTIFRVQTPATINGRMKEQCYVFDFAPDRTLKVIAETAQISAKAGKTSQSDRKAMGEFINFCPIISIEGSQMNRFDVPRMLEQLKRVYVERVVRNGFEDNSLYNDELMKLDDLELQEFDDLKKIIGQTKAMPKTNQVDINSQGLNNEEYEEKEKLEKKPKKELTEEERKRLEELKKKTKNREAAISILRGISIRMPLLIYGAELSDENHEITIDNFASLIDPQSWEEFMPKGVTKQKFNSFKKYYDPEIFCAAGKRIRAMARAADKLSIEERIERITNIFNTFRNPDKETVLTPWRVVNMHLGDCLGGYNFYDTEYQNVISEPRFIDKGGVTAEVFSPESRILEINSKSGLYPLYMAYGIYRARAKASLFAVETVEEQQSVWDKVIAENIFVICKTPMAKSITKRTLAGFRKAKTNMWAPEDLINKIKNQSELFIKKVHDLIGKDMKINAIVGNPPYQINDGSGASDDAANPIYQIFVRIAKQIRPEYFSLIMPSKWMIGGKAVLKPFRKEMMEDKHIASIYDYEDSGECFNGQHIDGGICYFLWSRKYEGLTNYTYKPTNEKSFCSIRHLSDGNSDIIIRDNRRQSIINKFSKLQSFSQIVSARKPFGINTDIFNNKSSYPEYRLNDKPYENSVLLWGVYGIKGGAKRITGYIDSNAIKKNRQWINKYKLFISKAYSADAIVPPEIIIAPPGVVCSETFLVIGPFENSVEQNNVNRYLKTNFCRILLFFGRGTMQVSQDVFRFVPLQDFTSLSDIDWNKSIPEIDNQLYAKYQLTNEEVAFVESMIKPI